MQADEDQTNETAAQETAPVGGPSVPQDSVPDMAEDSSESTPPSSDAPQVDASAPDTSVSDDASEVTDSIADDSVAEAPAAMTFRYDEKYYAPLSPDAPTGAALEFYHFSEMEQEAAWPQNDFGRPDPKQRPNFRAVRDTALGFLNGTKDLKATRDIRPLLALALAEAGDKGPVGLAKALDLFITLTMEHWEAIHPGKEDEDDDEFMTRMEDMRKYMNPSVFALAVESVGIARSPRVGDLTTRTFGIAATKLSPREGEFAPNADALTALLAEEDDARASVTEAHAAYHYAIDRLRAFEAFLAEHPDVDPIDLAAVAEALEKQVVFIEPYIGGAAPTDSIGDAAAGDTASAVTPGSAPFSAPIGGANTLDEAMELIDDILTYYARSGRSSPVPLGLIALRDLMAGDFNTWIAQTASSGLTEAAINISAVDASRLSSFTSGEIPAAVAPAATVELDFSDFDAAFYEAETAFSALDNAVYAHQQTLPPEEGEENNTVLEQEVLAIRAALDKLYEKKGELGNQSDESDNAGESVENTAEGDGRHSRITDRNGVKQSLDAVAAYFEREEPSSPAPAYLKRLRSLVDARFTEIARELMPEEGGEAKLRLEAKTNMR